VGSAGRLYFSALKSFSFSSWAFSKASLNRLASGDDRLAYIEFIVLEYVELTLAVGETDSQGLSLGLTLADIGGRVPDPAAVTADVGAQLHVGDDYAYLVSQRIFIYEKKRPIIGCLTVVVGADLQGLIPTHDETGLLVLLVLEQTNITSATLLPLLAVTVELEELGAHLEGLLLELLVGLGLDTLGQADDWLEVNFGGFRSIILGVL
jgi:hypothetical protein